MLFSDYEGSRLEFLKILVELGEEPAFLRRSRQVSEALEHLHDEAIVCASWRVGASKTPRTRYTLNSTV